MSVTPIEDLDLVFDSELSPPCETCESMAAAEWILRLRKHEHCDDGKPAIFLICERCRQIAHDRETMLGCSVCDELRPLLPYLIAIEKI